MRPEQAIEMASCIAVYPINLKARYLASRTVVKYYNEFTYRDSVHLAEEFWDKLAPISEKVLDGDWRGAKADLESLVAQCIHRPSDPIAKCISDLAVIYTFCHLVTEPGHQMHPTLRLMLDTARQAVFDKYYDFPCPF